MLSHRIRGLWNAYNGILAVILTLVFWSYLMIMGGVFKIFATPHLEKFITLNISGIFGLIIAAVLGRSAAATLLAGGFLECHTLAFKQTMYVGVTTLVVLMVAMEVSGVSQQMKLSLGIGFLLLLYAVLLICHLTVPKRLADFLFSSYEHEQRTLLIGSVEKARKIAKWIEETAAFAFGMRGSVIDDDDEKSRILHVTRVANATMLERIIKNEGIRQIILLEMPIDSEVLGLIVNVANRSAVRVLVACNFDEIFNHDVTLFTLHEQTFISFRNEPLEDPVNRGLKRGVDLVITLPVLMLIAFPFCIAVKIIQAIQSPGPLFSRETRSGFANRPFRVFVFRTVRATETSPVKQARNEFYPMGRFLSRSSLDQVPQFINVLLGDMSVVGPEPHPVIHNRRFSEIMDEYHVRTFAKPGITGLAQTHGFRREAKDEQDVVESAKLDIQYVENWSLPLDFSIMFKSMIQLIKPPPTAY